jgi:hypothetical protein
MSTGSRAPDAHGSVAEEIAALAEALRARRTPGAERSAAGTDPAADPGAAPGEAPDEAHEHGRSIDACEICPVCRAIAALHTVSPAAVTSLADLAHQAEVTLRALAVDLRAHGEPDSPPAREDIPVDDLGGLGDDD